MLRPGGALVASDSLASDELEAHHEGDTYNPVDPSSLPARLTAAGFVDVDVRTNSYGWAVIARTARNWSRSLRTSAPKSGTPLLTTGRC